VILKWTPAGEAEREYSIIPGDIRSPDAERIEDVGNAVWETFWQWEHQFRMNKTRAMRAALWISRLPTEPGLEFAQVDFARGEVWVEWSNDERRSLRQEIRNRKGLSDEARAALLDAIAEPDGGDEDMTPLEPSASPNGETTTPTSGTNTGG
jgi:hypothetical protein